MDEPLSALRATAHPLRVRILSLLTNTSLSASDVARELGTTPANASYHLRLLARSGLVVESGERQIRGGVAKLYTHPWEQSVASGGTTDEERQTYLRVVADELVRRAALRADDAPLQVADAELWVTPETHAEVRDLLDRAARLLHGRALPARTEGAERVSLTSVVFRMQDEQ